MISVKMVKGKISFDIKQVKKLIKIFNNLLITSKACQICILFYNIMTILTIALLVHSLQKMDI